LQLLTAWRDCKTFFMFASRRFVSSTASARSRHDTCKQKVWILQQQSHKHDNTANRAKRLK
jgi:hypothetical protein